MSGVSVLQTTARLRKFQTSAKSSGRRSKWVQSAHLAAAVPWDGVSWFSPIGHHHQARERSGSSTGHTAPGTQPWAHSTGHGSVPSHLQRWARSILLAAPGTGASQQHQHGVCCLWQPRPKTFSSVAAPSSSVHLDGVFREFQELEEFVFPPLLQSHQCSCFLLHVLVGVEDDLGSLLRLFVPGVLEELLQRLLVDALKDVGHGFLAQRGVEAVAVH